MSSLRPALLVLSIACLVSQAAARHSNDRFQSWLPGSGLFTKVIKENCTQEFDTYLASIAGVNRKLACDVTISCILGAVSERTKAVLAGASIILGLTPTLLTLLGPTAAETALLSLYRPILAALLNFGSPSSNPLRGVDYSAPIDDYIKEKAGRVLFHRRYSPMVDLLIVTVELLFAAGAVALVMVTSYELGYKTVSTIYCNDWFGPLLWALLSIVIYLLSYVTLSTRVVTRPQTPPSTKKRNKFLAAMKREFVSCGSHELSIMAWGNETYLFIVAAWLVSIFSAAHLVYGTFWFSTLTFINASDAITIMARYMAAAIVCRIICTYELNGLRQVMIVEDHRTVTERKSK